MRDTIERTLNDDHRQMADGAAARPGVPFLLALSSQSEQLLSLVHPLGATLREVVGYDCQGAAAYLGHSLIRDRYEAARSMDELDLTTVFSIAVDALEAIRSCLDACGKATEMVVLYADGHASDVNRMLHDSQRLRTAVLDGLAHAVRR
jgi:prepilin-type processing-associated H-X9-DG protein